MPGRTGAAMRSRAVSFPCLCCRAILSVAAALPEPRLELSDLVAQLAKPSLLTLPAARARRTSRGCSRSGRWFACRGRTAGRFPGPASASMSSFGMMPPPVIRMSSRPCSLQQLAHARKERHVRAAEDRQPHDVDVFLDGGGGDHLGRLVQSRVDHFHSRHRGARRRRPSRRGHGRRGRAWQRALELDA